MTAQEMDTGRTVGARIRELRQGQGWTQEEFAKRGERNVTLRTMRTIADTLRVGIANLTKGL